MADLISLGIKVTNQGVSESAAGLDKLTSSADKAGAASDRLSKSAGGAAPGLKAQKDALAALIGQIDPTVAALGRLDDQERKLASFKAKGLIDTDSFNDYNAKIQASRDSLSKFTDTQNKAGLSAKALANANRVLPAQFTDIVVSLSSGQKPLTVLLQQGGQIKDMYGGVGAALKGVGGYILGLLNPITLTAAAIAAVGAAFLAGQGEAEDFNKAIIITGNAAGVTTDQLSDMSKQIGATVGGQHAAAAALAEVASAGTFTAGQLGEVTKAALQLQKTGGQAIGDTVKQFQKLAEDPAKASAELNKQYGYLTASVYDQIKALQDQGKATEAADLAMKTYADSINDRTPQIQQNLGLIQQAWVAIKGAVVGATNAVLDFGRNETGTEAVARLQSQIKLLQNGLNSGGLVGQGAENAKQQIAELTNELVSAQYEAAEKEGKAAADGQKTVFNKRYTAYAEEADKYKSDSAKKQEEITKAQTEGDALYADAIKQGNTQLAAQIRARQKAIIDGINSRGAKGSSGASLDNAENSAQLQDYKDQLAALTKSYDDQQKVLDAKRKGDLIEQQDYYSQSTKLVQDSADAQVKAINDEIAALQARSVSGVAAINNQKQIAQLQADAVKVQADAQQKLTLLRIEEEAETKKTTAAINSYIEALGQQTKARQNEIDAQVQSIGLGDKEFSRLQTLNKITSDAADQQLKLAKARAAGQIDQNTYDQETKALQDAVDARVKAEQDGFEKIDAAQADWTNGAKKAFQDFADEAANTAESTRKIFSDAFDGLSDVITDFITTGKADFKGFLDQLVKEIVASQVKQALANQFSGLFGSSGTASAGGGSYGSIADLFSSGSFSYFKDGGAFQNGKLQKFANGGVVNTPTFFGFGNGSMGVAGEAGDEGILPLRRGPNGKLGVESHGSNGGGRNYSLNQTFLVAGNPDKKTRMQLASENGRQITTAVRRTA